MSLDQISTFTEWISFKFLNSCSQQSNTTPAIGACIPMSPRITSPAHPSSGLAGGLTGAGRGRGIDKRDLEVIGQTVRITQGPFKGNMYFYLIKYLFFTFN